MARIKQCFSWWCFAGVVKDVARFFRDAKAIGYAGVELLPPELWPVALDARLEIVSIDGHASIIDGLNRRENHARIEEEIGRKIELLLW